MAIKIKTSISITEKTLKFLKREDKPVSEQIDLDINLLAEIIHVVEGDQGDCPFGRQLQSLIRFQKR